MTEINWQIVGPILQGAMTVIGAIALFLFRGMSSRFNRIEAAINMLSKQQAAMTAHLQSTLDMRGDQKTDHDNVVKLVVRMENFETDVKRNWDVLRDIQSHH